MPEIVLSLDGEERTVSTDNIKLPDGFTIVKEDDVVSKDELRENYVLQAELKRRFKNWVPRDKAIEDEEIRNAILAAQPPAPNLEEAEKQWSDRRLKPALNELSDLKRNLVMRGIREAAQSVGIADQFVTRPSPDKPSYIEAMYADQIAYNSEYGYEVALDGQGNPIPSQKPTAVRPYMSVGEFFSQLAEQDSMKPFLKASEKNDGGPGHNPGRTGGAPPATTKAVLNKDFAKKKEFVERYGWDTYNSLPEK